jgi:hypothetical protein
MSGWSLDGGEAQAVRGIGHDVSGQGTFTRVVESFTRYEAPLDFRSLCARVLHEGTRYLILDLDRTIHRGRNLGELLGWEVAAYEFYGSEPLQRLQASRARGRFFWDPSEPERLPAYLLKNVRTWAFPGLSYLLWGKLAARFSPLERWSYRKFGTEPVRSVQRIPQTALLHVMTALPAQVLRQLAQRVWDRFQDDLVVEAADLAWVRERCPGIKIILTSASPKPMLEVAGKELGVDAVEFSGTPEHQGWFAAPYWVDPRFALGRLERIAGPHQVRINSGPAKIEHLRQRFPDLFTGNAECVGISDTGYGEDHVWGQYFDVVVDVNSSAPFPPIVAFDSPLREVHSAQLLTRAERAHGSVPVEVLRLGQEELTVALAAICNRIEALAREYHGTQAELCERSAPLRERMSALHQEMETTIEHYNQAPHAERGPWFTLLRAQLREEASLRQALARTEEPLALLRMDMTRCLRAARLDAVAPVSREVQVPAQPLVPRLAG